MKREKSSPLIVKNHKAKFLSFIAATLVLGTLQAQSPADTIPFDRKALLKTVKAYAKEDNYTKVDAQLSQAFTTYPQAAVDAELLRMEMDAQWQLAQAENKKLFLNSKPDTATYFTRILATTQYALRCDSIDRIPDAHGRIHPRHAKALAERLRACRNNLLSGGKYFYKRADYATAWQYLNMFLDTRHHPLLADQHTPDSVQVARLAAISAFEAQRPADALRYITMAEQDTTVRCPLMELQARALEQLGQEQERLALLAQANTLYPANDYFAMALIHHHDSLQQYHQALAVAQQTILAGGNPRHYAYLAGRMNEALGQLDSAANNYTCALQAAPDDPIPHAALGRLALRRASLLRQQTHAANLASDEQTRQQLRAHYQQAAQHLERARNLAPKQPELWREGLREVYFRLNRGDELQQIEGGDSEE